MNSIKRGQVIFALIQTRFASTKNALSKRPILPKKEYDPSSISHFFVDFKSTKLRAGKGGDGLVSFMNLKEKEFCGPDGGDGGNGGHVLLQVDSHLKSLNKVQSLYRAEDGEDGRSKHMKGKSGEHLVIKVPNGTIVKSPDGKELLVLGDTINKFIAARGGAGGKGNHYYLSNDNRKPLQFEYGHQGQEVSLNLELKLLADAAFIGLPNAGKSSLLHALTRARPKIGDYSFTTQHPHVGIVEYEDFQQISLADFPGLLPDLSRGFGTRYLHHLDRSKIILPVVDISSEDPAGDLQGFFDALNSYNKAILSEKPVVLIANKADKVDYVQARLDSLKERFANRPIIPMSAEKRINLTKFLTLLRRIYDDVTSKDSNTI